MGFDPTYKGWKLKLERIDYGDSPLALILPTRDGNKIELSMSPVEYAL